MDVLVQVEVLAKRLEALIVYGHRHFQRRQIMASFEMSDWRAQTIVSLIERATSARVFSIWRLDDALRAVDPRGVSGRRHGAGAPRRGPATARAFSTSGCAAPRSRAFRPSKPTG